MTAPSQVALNLDCLPEEHVGSIPTLWVLQSILLNVNLTMDKTAGFRGREGGQGRWLPPAA